MKTVKPRALAAAQRSTRCSTVSFSMMLSFSSPQFRPVGLGTSFCGSITTKAVSEGSYVGDVVIAG
jgi:hypothetical protein